MAKTGAKRQRADCNRIERPGFACRHSAFNRPAHRLGARCGECADVDKHRIRKRGKLLGFFGFNHHRRGSAKRQQNVGRKGLHDIVGHTVRERGMGSELM